MRRRDLFAYATSDFGGIAALGSAVEAASVRGFSDESASDERSLERRDQRCAGDEADEATIRFADDGVLVEGLIRTPTPCHELELEFELEPASPGTDCDALAVRVAVGRPEEVICVQCLGVVEYEARIDPDGRPDRVEVVHDRGDEAVDVAAADR